MVAVSSLPYCDRVQLYSQVWDMRRQGKSYSQISKELDIPKSTVAMWLEKRCKPSIRYKDPDLSPSPELSYLIGAFYADGTSCWERGKQYKIMFRVRDRDFIEEIAKSIDKLFGWKKSTIGVFYQRYKQRRIKFYQLQLYSKTLSSFLRDFQRCRCVTDTYPAEFIRGFADGDGTVYNKGRQKRVVISNKDLNLLKYVKDLLDIYKIRSSLYVRRCGMGMLYVLTHESLTKWGDLIGFTIKRKQLKLQQILQRSQDDGAKTAEVKG